MVKAYIYPNSAKDDHRTTNPYVRDFIASLAHRIDFVNSGMPTSTGLLDVFRYGRRFDLVFLNWIEDVPERRGGYFQSVILFFWLMYLKRAGIKIFVTIHNKYSHSERNTLLKKHILRYVVRRADYLLTHACEGLKFLETIIPQLEFNARMYHHPMKRINRIHATEDPQYDYLIWGEIRPHKGIENLLDYAAKDPTFAAMRVLIIGAVRPTEYYRELQLMTPQEWSFENRFIAFEELTNLASRCRAILVPYSSQSVLSSGILMDSLALGIPVIGPPKGAFLDLAELGLVSVYRDLSDLPGLVRSIRPVDEEALEAFMSENSWEAFGERVWRWIAGAWT